MIEALLAGLFGLLIGSFLNVCIHRLPQDLSVVAPRSSCPACGQIIAWYDNVPLLSYLMLQGRCRHCNARISWRYPVVELLTAACFFHAVLAHGASGAALRVSLLSALLIGLFFTDLEERILPDEMTLGGALAGLLLAWFVPLPEGLTSLLLPRDWSPNALSLFEAAAASVALAGLLWLVGELYFRLRKREGLGFGDVKLIAMLGAFLGLHGTLLTLVVGSVSGSIFGLALLARRGREAATYELPFGSFLAAAGLLLAHLGPLTP